MFGEPKFEMKQPNEFRDLVEDLVKNSETLKDRVISIGGIEEKINILDAIEGKGLTDYADGADDKTLDAIHCLMAIYDELKKDEPDDDFIEETVERLKEYL